MEEKQQQQPLREVPQPKRRAQQPAGRSPEWSGALRAAAAVRAGGLAFARLADLQALGALVGNSALQELLATPGLPLEQPFSYRPSGRVTQPFPVDPAPLALCGPVEFPASAAGLEPYPAAAFTGGGWA